MTIKSRGCTYKNLYYLKYCSPKTTWDQCCNVNTLAPSKVLKLNWNSHCRRVLGIWQVLLRQYQTINECWLMRTKTRSWLLIQAWEIVLCWNAMFTLRATHCDELELSGYNQKSFTLQSMQSLLIITVTKENKIKIHKSCWQNQSIITAISENFDDIGKLPFKIAVVFDYTTLHFCQKRPKMDRLVKISYKIWIKITAKWTTRHFM